jgi:hypothetical protein
MVSAEIAVFAFCGEFISFYGKRNEPKKSHPGGMPCGFPAMLAHAGGMRNSLTL